MTALSVPDHSPSMLARVFRGIALALLVALALLYAFALAAPAVGLHNDDGIYLVTAKALAEGRGYRIVSTPDAMWQTKYPPLYPAALSVVWTLWPRFPANLPALKLLSFAFLVGWLVLSYRYLIREMQVPAVAALWIIVLIAGTTECLNAGALLMSEGLFGLLVYASLRAAARVRSTRSHWWLVAAVCAAGAFYTRTSGLMLLPAIAAGLLYRRHVRQALAFLAVAGLLALGWPCWQRTHPTLNQSGAAHYHSKENYTEWNVFSGHYSAGERITIITDNLTYIGLIPARMFRLEAPGPLLILTLLGSAGLWLALLRGAGRARLAEPAIFVLLMLCVPLAWAWAPYRFCLPLLPVMLGFTYHGLPRPGRIGTAALTALALLFALPSEVRTIASNQSAVQFQPVAPDWGAISRMHAWIRDNLPAGAVVGSAYDAALYLYTGHPSVPFAVSDNRHIYGIAQPTVEEGARDTLANIAAWKIDYVMETGRDALDEPRFDAIKARLESQWPRRCLLVVKTGYEVCEAWNVPERINKK